MLLLWFGVRQITSIGNVSTKSSPATFPLSQASRLRGLAAKESTKIVGDDFSLTQATRLAAIPEEKWAEAVEVLADDNVPDAVKEKLPKAVKDQMERPVSLLAKGLQIERVEDEAHDSITQLYWDILGVPGS